MTDKPTLAYLYHVKQGLEDMLKIVSDAPDIRMYKDELVLVNKDIAELERPTRIEFSNNPPMGSA